MARDEIYGLFPSDRCDRYLSIGVGDIASRRSSKSWIIRKIDGEKKLV